MSDTLTAAGFQKVAVLAELPLGARIIAEVDEHMLALFNVDGQIYAIDDICTHDDGPLSDGTLDGFAIACPRHGAKFDVRNGHVLSMPATRNTRAYEVQVEGQGIYIRTGNASPTAPAAAPATAGAPVESKKSVPDSSAAAATAPKSTTVNASEGSPVPTIVENAPTGPLELNEDSIREALKQVIDPELFVNIVDLGLIYGVTLAERPEGKSNIAIDMTMTSPACPAGPQLIQNSKDVLKRLEGVEDVEVKLVMIPPWTPDRMTEAAKDQLGIF